MDAKQIKQENKEFEAKLIIEVKNNLCLYAKNDPGYNNKHKRQAAWEDISCILGRSVEECQKKWCTLRDSFRSYYRMESNVPSGSGSATCNIKWIHFQSLRFLIPYVKTNKEKSKTSEVDPSSSNVSTGLDNPSIEEQPIDKIDIKDETYYFPSYSPSASQLDDYSQEEFRPPQISEPKKCNKRKRQTYEDDHSNSDKEEELVTLKKNKLQLEIYNLRLDALKKEIDLGLPRSQFTEELYKNWQVPIKEEPLNCGSENFESN